MRFGFLFFLLIGTLSVLANDKPKNVIYLHPKPNSTFISPQTSLLLKVDPILNANLKPSDFTFSIIGETSGRHTGEIVLSDNTVIFKPNSPFAENERVNVDLKSNLLEWGTSFRYSFFTKENDNIEELYKLVSKNDNYDMQLSKESQARHTTGTMSVINGVAVPGDFPLFQAEILKDGIAPGKIFINNWIGSPYIMIFENDGTPYAYQRVEERARDFKVQLNGQLTRRIISNMHCFVGMDNNFAITDTFRCVNGYGTDEHELQVTEDGHYFLIALGSHRVDMSQLVTGGRPDARLIDNHVQEFDENGNLVFEWLCTDYFDVLDAVHENLRADNIDYIHMNSIAIDYDDNIIISSRHLSEVTKINRQTGEIIWRLGGEHNQFEFLNTPDQNSYQHDARPVPGKPNHYTMMDNGNYHTPQYSRGVEFALDLQQMTATMVWEYRYPNGNTGWMGNVQRQPNGNTYINWADASLPKATEVTPDGEVVYQADFVRPSHSYRAFRFDWSHVFDAPYLLVESFSDRINLIFNKFGDTNIKNYQIYAGTSPGTMTLYKTTTEPYAELVDLQNETRYYFKVQTENNAGEKSAFSNVVETFVKYTEADEELIVNGDFSDDDNGWTFLARDDAVASGSVEDGMYHVQIDNPGAEYWNVQLIQEEFPIIQGRTYIFEFDARADGNRLMEPRVAQNGGNFTIYSKTTPIALSRQMKHYAFEFTMTDPTDYQARVVLNCGTSDIDCYFDNVSVSELVTSKTEKKMSVQPSAFRLKQNYPNPFNPVTTIRYEVPTRSYVKIQVYNVLGEFVEALVDASHEAGIYETSFDASDLGSGVYFYTMDGESDDGSASATAVKKLIVFK